MVAQTQSQMGQSSSSTLLLVGDIYTQVMGSERHGRVHGLGFGATPTLVFGTTKKETNAVLASKQSLRKHKKKYFGLHNVKDICNNKFNNNKINCNNKNNYNNNRKWR